MPRHVSDSKWSCELIQIFEKQNHAFQFNYHMPPNPNFVKILKNITRHIIFNMYQHLIENF